MGEYGMALVKVSYEFELEMNLEELEIVEAEWGDEDVIHDTAKQAISGNWEHWKDEIPEPMAGDLYIEVLQTGDKQ